MNIEEVEKKCFEYYNVCNRDFTELQRMILSNPDISRALGGCTSVDKANYLIDKWEKQESQVPAEVNKLSFSECKPTVPNTDESYNKPKRYSTREINGMDVIDISEHFKLNPQEFNILKYLLRDKGQDYDDMLKISDYALRESKLIKQRENK